MIVNSFGRRFDIFMFLQNTRTVISASTQVFRNSFTGYIRVSYQKQLDPDLYIYPKRERGEGYCKKRDPNSNYSVVQFES